MAGFLACGGAEVTLITDTGHAKAISAKGLIIDSPERFALVTSGLRATDDPNADGTFELLLLAGRPSETAAVLSRSTALLNRSGALASIQNRVDFSALGELAGDSRPIIGASVTEFFELIGPAMVRAQRPTDVDVYVGTFDEGRQAADLADRLVTAFTSGGLVVRRAADIRQVIWEKQVQLANAACWSVLMLSGNPELTLADGLGTAEGAEQFVATARELLSVYQAMGFEPGDFFGPRSLLGTIASAPSDAAAAEQVLAAGQRHVAAGLKVRTSRHEDLVRRRTTEVETLVAPFIKEAAARDLPVPLVRAAYRAIRLTERSWAQCRAS